MSQVYSVVSCKALIKRMNYVFSQVTSYKFHKVHENNET